MTEATFFVEERIPGAHVNRFPAKRVLFRGQSGFQTVEIIETEGYGRMLLNDGLVMCTERDEFIYHEMIAHPALFAHPNPKRVLVIGGGDGGTLREALRHPEVESCVMVEIDRMVVEACREHLPLTAAAMDKDPRAQVIIDDGIKFVKTTREKFDIALVDSTDPIGPATPLFGVDFYRDLKRCLNPGGIVVAQGESPFFNGEMQRKLLEIQKGLFARVHIYNFSNLTYPGGLWSFTWASDEVCPIAALDARRVARAGIDCRYYNTDIHRAAFRLPEFQRKNLTPLLSALPKSI